MDTAANRDEVRLRKGESFNGRLGPASLGIACCLFAIFDFAAAAQSDRLPLRAIAALLAGCLLLARAIFKRNVVWIITRDGILIGEQRPLAQVRRRMIDNHDIADISVRENKFSYPAGFSLACKLASGDVVVSPPLPDITRVNETSTTVSRLLGLPDAAPVNNRLDAANDEIVLGSPVSSDFGRAIQMTVPIVAGLCSLPFLIAFWIGESRLLLGSLLLFGLITAFALHRHAHRLAGSFWIIRHGEIRIEQIALNGQPVADTIRARDVAMIEVGKVDEDRFCTISIRLNTGQTFRTPTKFNENEAHAVRAEIIRRLNAPADIEKAR